MDYHGGHKADGRFNYEYKYGVYQFLLMTSLKTGSAFAYQFDRNVLDTIVSCLDTGFLAVAATLYDVNGAEIAEAYKKLDPRGYAYFALSLFAQRKDFGCVMPFYWADLNVVNGSTVQCVSANDRGRSVGVFQISLGKFSPEELKSVGRLEIKVGHMKGNVFSE